MILGRLYDLALLTTPITLTLGVSRSESEIALSQEWGGRLIMNEKDVSHPFMTMILTCVTMVRWADVQDSDRGDFRRRCAVDISSYNQGSLSSFQQSGKKQTNLVAKICGWLPKLVATVSSEFQDLVNTGLAVGFLVKWLLMMVAHTCKVDKVWMVYISPIGIGAIQL